MISQGRNAVFSVWWGPHLKRTTGDLYLNFLFSLSTRTVVHLKFPLFQYLCEKLVINNFHIINIHMKTCSIKISALFISMWKVVTFKYPLYQYPGISIFINNFHIVNIRMKSCSLKKSTLFISISKVVHLRFPLYQHPHTKLLIKNFHIIEIHRKSCLLKNFHFIKTQKHFFYFNSINIHRKVIATILAPLSPHKFSLTLSLT